ncbi:MAG: hypothetical protein IH944_12530 [Armatimonadetes bacterium]|nr:hypothetical protein [Armatimonadota bacterium]
MIVAEQPIPLDELKDTVIAVPGELTSAFLQLHLWFADHYTGGLPWSDGLEKVSGEAVARALDLHPLTPSSISPRGKNGGGGTGRTSPAAPSSDGRQVDQATTRRQPGDNQTTAEGQAAGFLKPKFTVVPFDEIIPAIKSGKVKAGLIIHESQLTYEREGLVEIVNMGKWWQERTGGLPLPLGVNVVRKDLGTERCADVSRCMRESIAAGLDNREKALDYALQFARDMDRETSDEFVGMYVNDRTRDMGEDGIKAIRLMLGLGSAIGMVPATAIDVID